MNSKECLRCGHKWEGDSIRCKNCGLWNISDSTNEEVKPIRKEGLKTLIDYEDVQVKKIKSGGNWDETFGGGLVPGSVFLLKGDPGAGKSTLLTQIIKELTSTLKTLKKTVLYISSEESGSDIKGRFKRIGLTSKTLELVYFVSTLQEQVDIEEAVESCNPLVLIIDSLQGLSRILEEQLEICEQLKIMAGKKSIIIFAVSQVTKGDDFAGLKATQHAVDGTFELVLSDETRILAGIKNRYGPTPAETYYEMTERGLIPYVEKDEE